MNTPYLVNLHCQRINFLENLFATKFKSSIYQRELNGGVAQLVRARTHKPGQWFDPTSRYQQLKINLINYLIVPNLFIISFLLRLEK